MHSSHLHRAGTATRGNCDTGELRHGGTAARGNCGTRELRHGGLRHGGTEARGNCDTGELRHGGTGELRHGGIATRGNYDTGILRHGYTAARGEQWHTSNSSFSSFEIHGSCCPGDGVMGDEDFVTLCCVKCNTADKQHLIVTSF
ncbi:hypothetical protein ACOMHN_060745 [Nucella lapillus]